MENVITFLITAGLFVFSSMTMSQNFLSSVDSNTISWSNMETRDAAITRGNLTQLGISQPSADKIEVSLRNSGQTKFRDFQHWDVIVQYTETDGSTLIKWLPYVSGPTGNDQWTMKGIYRSAASLTAEVFEPGILNINEEAIVQAQVNPPVKTGSTNLVVIATENGIETWGTFTR